MDVSALGVAQSAVDDRAFDEARTLIAGLTARFPDDPRPWALLGSVEEDTGRLDAAIESYQRARMSGGLKAGFRAALLSSEGRCRQSQRLLEQAADLYHQSIELKPTSSRLVMLGAVQRELGLMAEAERAFRAALELEASHEEAMYNLALTVRRDAPAEAVRLLRRALEVCPDYSQAGQLLSQLEGEDQPRR